MHELPLVFFTVLGQMGAGAVLISSLYRLMCKQSALQTKILRVNLIALIVMAIGMVMASFHLGHPLRALNVIFGIGRSPMSNEIFTFSALFGITFFSVFLNYFGQSTHRPKFPILSKIADKINSIIGVNRLITLILIIGSLFFIWTIVTTYMLPTVKNWDTPYTILQMYCSMLILGGLVATVCGIRTIGIIFFTIGTLIVLATKLPYISFINNITPELAQAQYCFWQIQCGLLVIALIITLINRIKCNKFITIFYGIATLLALTGELAGRVAFYNLWAIPM